MHDKSWLIQLLVGTKRKVCDMVVECPLKLNGIPITAHLNVLLLESYGVLIDMDWVEQHRSKLDYFHKVVKNIDWKGILVKARGTIQPILVK